MPTSSRRQKKQGEYSGIRRRSSTGKSVSRRKARGGTIEKIQAGHKGIPHRRQRRSFLSEWVGEEAEGECKALFRKEPLGAKKREKKRYLGDVEI